MADSVVEIVNIALIDISNTNTIDNLKDPTEEARIADAVWKQCLRRTLESAESWSFATKRKTLAAVADFEATNWMYAYNLPEDFVKLQGFILLGTEVPEIQMRAEYVIESREDGRRILLCNVEDVEIKYTWLNEVVPSYSSLFVDALAMLLSARLLRGLKGDLKVAAQIEAGFYLKVAEASASDRNQANLKPMEPRTPSLAARSGV